jgi:hypothetical protein
VFGRIDPDGYSSCFEVLLDPTEAKVSDILQVGQSQVLGPDSEGESVKVSLHKVSYPQPKMDADVGVADSVSPGRVLVAVEMTIRNLGGGFVYGTNVYPNFEAADGQKIEDTGWVFDTYSSYGSGRYSEELPDTVEAGQVLRGYSLYEIPPKKGKLIFPFGPDLFRVAVNP